MILLENHADEGIFRFLGDVSGCHTVGGDLSCCINVLESAMAILQQGKGYIKRIHFRCGLRLLLPVCGSSS